MDRQDTEKCQSELLQEGYDHDEAENKCADRERPGEGEDSDIEIEE